MTIQSPPFLSFFWPKKKVPTWLEEIKFKGESNGVPIVEHSGFGVIVRREKFHALLIAGTFIRINSAGMELWVTGQGGGVHCHFKFTAFLRAIFTATPSQSPKASE